MPTSPRSTVKATAFASPRSTLRPVAPCEKTRKDNQPTPDRLTSAELRHESPAARPPAGLLRFQRIEVLVNTWPAAYGSVPHCTGVSVMCLAVLYAKKPAPD